MAVISKWHVIGTLIWLQFTLWILVLCMPFLCLYHHIKSSRHTLNYILTLLNLYPPPLCLNSLPELPNSFCWSFIAIGLFLTCFQRFSTGLGSGDYAGLSKSLIPWDLNQSWALLKKYLGLLSYWTIMLSLESAEFSMLGSGLSSRMNTYCSVSIHPSISTSILTSF